MITSRSSRSLRGLLRRIPRAAEVGDARFSALGSQQYSSSTFPKARLLEGEVAVVTGGASGIGEATARLFTRHGARVFIADVNDSLGEEVAKQCGPQAEYVHCDVRKEEDIVKTWERAFSLDNKLDIVFNNAGIGAPYGPIDELDMAKFDAVTQVNLRAAVLGVKHAARLMKPAGKGSIVCTASIASVMAGLGPCAYTIAKTGMVGLVRHAATELKEHGIRVNAVSPSGVFTPIVWNWVRNAGKEHGIEITDDMMALLKSKTAEKLKDRQLSAEDVANAVLYLSSDMGAMVSGHNLNVDLRLSTSREVEGTKMFQGILLGAATSTQQST